MVSMGTVKLKENGSTKNGPLKIIYLLFIIIALCVYVCANSCHGMCVKVRRQLCEVNLSFHFHVGSGNWIEVSGLLDKHWANSLAPSPHILKYWDIGYHTSILSILACLSLGSIAVMKHWLKATCGGGAYIILQPTVPHQGKLRWEPVDRNWSRGHEETLLRACFQECVHLQSLYLPGPTALGWYHPEWAGPSGINILSRKCHTDLSQDNLMEGIPQVRFHLPRWC